VKLSASDARRLLTWYAQEEIRSAKSHSGESGGGENPGILLTVGMVIARTPRVYRVSEGEWRGRSILDVWCEVFRLECALIDEMAAVKQKRRAVLVRAVMDDCDQRAKILKRYINNVRNHVTTWENHKRPSRDEMSMFELALDWMAYMLEHKLESASSHEQYLWTRRLTGRKSA